jgi:hypothetical protein
MALQTSRRRTWMAVAMVLGLVALSIGAWGLSRWAPFDDGDTALEWPENVAPLVEFIEAETNLQFLEPVDFLYLNNKEKFDEFVAPEPYVVTEADLAIEADDVASGRALGLWAGEVRLIDAARRPITSYERPVGWQPETDLIVVNAPTERSALHPYLQAELVIVLVQVLDNQHFGVADALIENSGTSQSWSALLGLSIGHALVVQEAYIDELSSDDIDLYDTRYNDILESYDEATSDLPPSYRAGEIAAQALGSAFARTLLEDDTSLLYEAMSTQQPTALDQLMLPTGKYLRSRDATEPIEAPAPPADAERLATYQFGPVYLYLLLSLGLPATEALTATDGWGNGAATDYRLDGVVCVDVHVIADSSDDADRLEDGLQRWALSRPATAQALVGRDGENLYISACDPGPRARQSTPTTEAVDHFFGRADDIAYRSSLTGKPALAECVSVTTFERYTATELYGFDFEGDITADIEEITDDCVDSL